MAPSVRPEVWRIRSWTVIGRNCGSSDISTVPSAFFFGTATLVSAKAGMYFNTGSARLSLPSSTRIMAATETIGLVIEAMRKIASVFIGALASLSRKPKASNIAILPLRAISTTAPGSSLFLTPSSMRSLSRFSRLETKPTSSGDCALGIPCAAAGTAMPSASKAAIDRTSMYFLPETRLAGIKARLASAHQISVHDPAVALSRCSTDSMDLFRHILQAARDQDLVRRSEIGAPIDVDVLVGEVPPGVLAVEHDDEAIDTGRPSLGESPARGDLDRLGDSIERDPVPRGQHLHGADARNDLVGKAPPRRDRLDVADGAVVERGITPGQHRADLPVGQLLHDHALEGLLLGAVQVVDAGGIIGRPLLARRARRFDDAVGPVLGVAPADFAAQLHHAVLGRALFQDEEDVDRIQRLGRLQGDEIGVAGADADDEQLLHAGS